LVVGAVVGIERLAASEPAGVRMLAIIGALMLGMKVLVSVEEQSAGRARLKPLSWFLFALGWPGMRPSAFAAVPGPPESRWPELLKQGLMNLSAGALLVALAWGVASATKDSIFSPNRVLIATILLLPGLSLFMHFGVFNLLAGWWRRWGASCHALFRAPLQSTSLTVFWGRRWNLAFSEMTTLVVFRPLRSVIGSRAATMLAFLFSGMLHELAISVPVGAGYGQPLLYFALHAAAMQIESVLSRRGQPVDATQWKGRLWTLAWLVLPLPILFHIPFLRGCIWPLIGLTDTG
jgi:alginate O-acetyltransferase complex protein AlgI